MIKNQARPAILTLGLVFLTYLKSSAFSLVLNDVNDFVCFS